MAYQAKPAMHDIGGREAGPIDPSDHPLEPWHKLATAMSNVLGDGDHKLTCTDEARRTREALDLREHTRRLNAAYPNLRFPLPQLPPQWTHDHTHTTIGQLSRQDAVARFFRAWQSTTGSNPQGGS